MQHCNYPEQRKCPLTDPQTYSFWLKQTNEWVWLSGCTQLLVQNTHAQTVARVQTRSLSERISIWSLLISKPEHVRWLWGGTITLGKGAAQWMRLLIGVKPDQGWKHMHGTVSPSVCDTQRQEVNKNKHALCSPTWSVQVIKCVFTDHISVRLSWKRL